MAVFQIKEADDPRLDDYRGIRDREMRGRGGHEGLFVGEQPLIVEHMLRLPDVTRSVLVSPNWVERIAPAAPDDVPVYVAPLEIMKDLAGFNIHRGVLAVGYRDRVEGRGLDEALARRRVTLLLCENINNIDNIGLLFRNAAAFGVDGVMLSPRCHDPLYRKSLRVSIGHALSVPFARSRDWAADLRRLRCEHDVTIIAAATGDQAVPLDDVPRPRRVALLVGDEFEGLEDASLALCEHVVRVPMAEGVDSLNVAVAAAVCLHRLSTGARR